MRHWCGGDLHCTVGGEGEICKNQERSALAVNLHGHGHSRVRLRRAGLDVEEGLHLLLHHLSGAVQAHFQH